MKTLAFSVVIVALDFALAYSTMPLERNGILHQPLSYVLPTALRLVVACVVWRRLHSWLKIDKDATSRGAAGRKTILSAVLALSLAILGFAVAVLASRRGIRGVIGASDLIWLYPITEELVYRGILLRALIQRFNAAVAIGIDVLAFVLLHVGPYQSGWGGPDLAIWLAIGGATAVCFVGLRSLAACILIHSAANASLIAWQLEYGRI